MRATLIIVAAAVSSACVAKQLRSPVGEHRVQTQVVANRCDEAIAGADETVRAALEPLCLESTVTAKQACLIDEIVQGKDGSACGGGR